MDMMRKALNRTSPALANPARDPTRVPPHQIVTDKFPVMTVAGTPDVPLGEWRLRLVGLVEQEAELDWEALSALPQRHETRDFHCVTQWSKFDVEWGGVRASDVFAVCSPKPEATHVMLHCYDGYTTNVDLERLRADDVLFAHTLAGAPLDRDHGGPVRLVVPSVYGWKSAKWVGAVEFMAGDRPGFWEQRGYHMRGDYWKEERFGSPF